MAVALQQGWPEETEPLLRQILASDPGTLTSLSACLARQGRIPEATAMMRESLERDPTNGCSHFNLGAVLAGQGRDEEALAEFRSALENGFKNPRVYVAVAKMGFRLGQAATQSQAS